LKTRSTRLRFWFVSVRRPNLWLLLAVSLVFAWLTLHYAALGLLLAWTCHCRGSERLQVGD
jgi:hypothetical protein